MFQAIKLRRLWIAVAAGAAMICMAIPQVGAVQASSTVIVATRGFTEEQIAGYLYADMLQAHGVSVNTSHFAFGTEAEIIAALEHNQVDLIPDYIGNGLEVDLGRKYHAGTSAQKVWGQVNKTFIKRWNIHWLNPAYKFNDQNVFVTTKKVSRKLGLKTLVDLAKKASRIKMAILQECTTRSDCWLGFTKIYHPKKFKLLFDTSVNGTSLNHPPFYDDLLKGTYDVVQGYGTTDAAIGKYGLVALQDTKHLFPPDQFSPVIRGSVLKGNPKIKRLLNTLEPFITTAAFRHMNVLVAFNGKKPQAVARHFLKVHHLI